MIYVCSNVECQSSGDSGLIRRDKSDPLGACPVCGGAFRLHDTQDEANIAIHKAQGERARSNVVLLDTKRPVVAEVVKYLEETLAQAKAGDITGVLIVTEDTERGVAYCVAGIGDRMKVLGTMSHAMYKLQSDNVK